MENRTSRGWIFYTAGEYINLNPYTLTLRAELRNVQVELGKPKQFCTPMEGLSNGTPLYVAAFPVAWRIEVFDDDKYRGFEYVRSELDEVRYFRAVR